MSFAVADMSVSGVKLKKAILIYGDEGARSSQTVYATVHPVLCPDGQSAPVIGAGCALDRNQLRHVCSRLVKSSRVRSGILPEGVLSVGLDFVVWWQRPGLRTYFFDCRMSDGVSVGKRSGVAPAPGLVFVAKKKDLWVCAVQGNERPTADTPLFHAPLMNVWKDGRVCTGSMHIPDSSLAQAVAGWEQSFWDSNFSHPNHDKVVKYAGGIHKLSIDLLNGKFKRFPSRVLRPMEKTLGDLVAMFDGGGK